MFIQAPKNPKIISEPATEWQPHSIEDFSGGLNTEEPSASLRKNQFSAMSNWYIQPNGSILVRGPYRPWLVASEDTILPDSAPPLTFIVVELRGTNFRVACWDAGANYEVSVYDESNDRWAGEGAGTSIKTNLTDGYKPRFVKYSINEAEDLIFCNGKDTPQRWVGTVDTASSDLGLAAPTDVEYDITGITKANPAVITVTQDASGLSAADKILITDVAEDSNYNRVWTVASTSGTGPTTITTTESSAAYASAGTTGCLHLDGIIESGTAGPEEPGVTKNGTYEYTFTYFYDDSGTSTKYGEGPTGILRGLDITTITATNNGETITIDPFLDIPAGVTKINVYRAPPDEISGPFRLVGTITDLDSAWTDTTATGEEGVEAPIGAGTPPKLKNPLAYDSRIWGIGINSSGALTNKGVFTRRGAPDYFPALNFIYFPDALAGPFVFNKLIYWFTEKQVYVTTDLDSPETSTVKIADIGCDSFDSIVDVGNGLVWQFNGNIYWANFNLYNPVTGELPWPIGDPIRNKIRDIPILRRENSTGCLYKDRYYLSITGLGQTVNTATVLWDVKHGTRWLTQNNYGAWSSVDWSANDMQTFDVTLYTLDNTNKYIMEHDFSGIADYRSKTDYDASTSHNINTQLSTGIVHFGHEWSQKLVNSLSIVCKSTSVTFNTTISLDGGAFERTKSFTLGSGTFASDSTWLIWGQGTWGNFNWGSTSFGFQSDHKKYGKGGKCRNAKLTLESTNSQDTNIIGLKIYHKLLPTPS